MCYFIKKKNRQYSHFEQGGGLRSERGVGGCWSCDKSDARQLGETHVCAIVIVIINIIIQIKYK